MARLSSFPGLKNEAAKSDALPNRIKVFNWGRNPTLKGDFWLDDRSLNTELKTSDGKVLKGFEDVQKANGWDIIALDYEHNTVPGTLSYTESAEPRPVAAHLTCEIVRGDGMYCNVRDWTDSGKANAKNYADLSAAPIDCQVDGQNVVVGIHSVALTQHGATQDLTFLTSNLPEDMKNRITTLSAEGGAEKKKMKALRAMLSMGDDKTDDEVLACMEKLAADGKIGMREGPLNTAGGTQMAIKQFAAEEVERILGEKLTPLTASITKLTESADKATKAAEKSQRDTLVAQAGKENKIIPLSADAIERMPIVDLTEMISKLPKANLQRRAGQEPLVKANATGTIQRNGTRTTTLSINGVEVQVSAGGGTAEVKTPGSGLARTAQLFNEQLQRDNIPCQLSN